MGQTIVDALRDVQGFERICAWLARNRRRSASAKKGVSRPGEMENVGRMDFDEAFHQRSAAFAVQMVDSMMKVKCFQEFAKRAVVKGNDFSLRNS